MVYLNDSASSEVYGKWYTLPTPLRVLAFCPSVDLSSIMNSVEARRVMAVVDDTLDSLRCKAFTRTDKTWAAWPYSPCPCAERCPTSQKKC